MKRQHKQKKSFSRKTLFIWVGSLVVVAAVAIATLEVTNRTYFFHDAPRPVTASSDTKGEPQDAATTPVSDTPPPGKDDGSSNTGTVPGDNKASGSGSGTIVNLLEPTGDFVSSHKVNKSSGMTSTCSTTPGATCVITFTKGSETKSLPAQTTDRGGSAYWDWNAQQYLTAGTWRVTATATLSGQTKTAADATNLEVSE